MSDVEKPEIVPLVIHVPADKADRLARAVELAASVDSIEFPLEQYRSRVRDAFMRVCPDRHYTGTALDLDTMMAVIDVRLSTFNSGQHRRYTDTKPAEEAKKP